MLYVQVGNYGAYLWAHGCSLHLFIEFILKREVCIMQTETQKVSDVLYWYRWVLLKPNFLGAWKSVQLISNLIYLH